MAKFYPNRKTGVLIWLQQFLCNTLGLSIWIVLQSNQRRRASFCTRSWLMCTTCKTWRHATFSRVPRRPFWRCGFGAKNHGSDWRTFARAWRNGRRNPKEHRKKTATLCEKKKPIGLLTTPMRQYLSTGVGVFQTAAIVSVFDFIRVLYKYVETCDSSCIQRTWSLCEKRDARRVFLSNRSFLRKPTSRWRKNLFGRIWMLFAAMLERSTNRWPTLWHYRRRDSENVVGLGARGVLRCGFLWRSLLLYPWLNC